MRGFFVVVSSAAAATSIAVGVAACGSSVYSPGLPDSGSARGPDGTGDAAPPSVGFDALAPPSEGTAETVVTGIDAPGGGSFVLGELGLSSDTIFVVARGGAPILYNSFLVRTPKGGGPATAIADYGQTQSAGSGVFSGIGRDGSFVYSAGSTAIYRVPEAGGTTTLFDSSQGGGGTVADAGGACWITGSGPAVWCKPVAGGAAVSVLSGLPVVSGIALDATFLYVASGTNILRAPRASGGAAIGIASDTNQTRAIAVDDSFVYWGNSPCAISRAPKAGGSTQVVFAGRSGCDGLNGIAVDATHVWWTTRTSVMRIAKPL